MYTQDIKGSGQVPNKGWDSGSDDRLRNGAQSALGQAVRPTPAGQEIIRLAGVVAELAVLANARAAEKLSPLASPSEVRESEKEPRNTVVYQDMPQYFAELRSPLVAIEASLREIMQIVNRVEL